MRSNMPERSSNTSVTKWPDRPAVEAALRKWTADQLQRHPELLRLGYFGSYARGDWGVGSDLDIVAVVKTSEAAFERRASGWKTECLPVPAEMLVYTISEWKTLQHRATGFARMLNQETVWIYPFSAED